MLQCKVYKASKQPSKVLNSVMQVKKLKIRSQNVSKKATVIVHHRVQAQGDYWKFSSSGENPC